jgi:hypothetical protein
MKIDLTYIIVLLFLGLNFSSKGQPDKKMQQPDKPKAEYQKKEYQPKSSTINIPINISMKGLQKSINESLDGLIYEDKSYTDNDGDNLKIKVWKKGTITVKAETDVFEYYVPLKIWAKVRYGAFGAYTSQEVKGSIALNFRTNYEINRKWEMVTMTTMTSYKWIEKPTIKVFGSDISVQSIANSLLTYNKKMLETTIDDQIKANINIQQNIQDAWSMLQDPVNVNEDYNVWLKLTPKSIAMSPIITKNNSISSIVGIQSLAEVVISKEALSVKKDTKLPTFNRPENVPDSFEISLSSQIPYMEAEEAAKKELVGQTFKQGRRRKVTIKNINIYGQGKDIIIGTYLEGSYNGIIYMRGQPVFDPLTSTISIENVDYDLDTKNKLFKGANWLFRSTILKKMKPYLTFPLEDNLKDAKAMVEKELDGYKPMKGIVLNGKLSDLTIEDVQVTPDGIRVVVLTKGKIKMTIDGLTF